jgi:hypothetical protein
MREENYDVMSVIQIHVNRKLTILLHDHHYRALSHTMRGKPAKFLRELSSREGKVTW